MSATTAVSPSSRCGTDSVRRSFVDPARPSERRNAEGEILNSFLRPIRIDDPPGSRYFAGEMLCGVARAL